MLAGSHIPYALHCKPEANQVGLRCLKFRPQCPGSEYEGVCVYVCLMGVMRSFIPLIFAVFYGDGNMRLELGL